MQDQHSSPCGKMGQNSAEIEPTAPDLPASLLAQTVAQSPEAISITDARANILYVNEAFTRVTGYAPDEAIGNNESMLSDKRTPKRVYEELWQHLQAKQVWRGHLLNRHKNGRRYLADITIAPVLDERGVVTNYVGMHRDVTGLFSLEQTVRNQKTLIETVINALPVAAVLLDEEENRVILDNQAYKALVSDLSAPEPAHLFLQRLRDDIGPVWEQWRSAHRDFRDHELCFERGGQRAPRWYSCAGSWFCTGDERVDSFFQQGKQGYLLLVLTDITRFKQQQEEIRLAAMKALLAEEEKIASLRETLQAAAQQIRGPMNLLTAARKMLELRADPTSAGLLQVFGEVIECGERSIATLRDCLPAEINGNFSPLNVNALLHDVLRLETEALLREGIEVAWEPALALPSVLGAENPLRAMFKQLLDNAIEAMSRGRVKRRELRVTTSADRGQVRVWIEDSGPGIPPERRIQVFEPFFTVLEGGEHRVGMGLARVQEVINQHGAMIRIDPDYRDGCRMEILFTPGTKEPAYD